MPPLFVLSSNTSHLVSRYDYSIGGRTHCTRRQRYEYSSTRRASCDTRTSNTLSMTAQLRRSAPPELEPKAAISCEPVPDHEDWRFVGQTLTAGPMPAIIYFSLTAEQSLELDPYNQFVGFLNAGDKSKFRVFSVTLPFHTSDMKENEVAFRRWANIYNSGGDLVSGFVRKVSSTLNSFVADGYISPNKIYVAGLSRGALLAAHIAVSNPNVRACLGFSPVTVLHDLHEFSDAEIHSDRARMKIRRASLHNESVTEGLMRIPVRFYMGNSDTRVGTRNAFDAVHLVAERAAEEGVRSPPHEFIMYCRYVLAGNAQGGGRQGK